MDPGEQTQTTIITYTLQIRRYKQVVIVAETRSVGCYEFNRQYIPLAMFKLSPTRLYTSSWRF